MTSQFRNLGSKVINRQFFHRKTAFHMKILSIINFTTKLLSIKDYFLNEPQTERSLRSVHTEKFDGKVIDRQYFHKKTGLESYLKP